ncbi:hypothetical protein JCM3765_002659 [Sporobolomyces pararoseus]
MTPPTGSHKHNREIRREHVRISVASDSSPVGSRGSSPNRSFSSKLFSVVPPDSTTFELRAPSNATRRNTASPSTAPILPPSRFTSTEGGSGKRAITNTLLRRTMRVGRKILDSLWVQDESTSRNATPKPHLHGDDDLPSTSSPVIGYKPHSSHGLSRFGQIIVLLLLLLGLSEVIGTGGDVEEEEARRRPIRVKGRNPFSVLKDLTPRSSPYYSTSIPSLESTWKSKPGIHDGTRLGVGESGGGDVTAILLHWKRTDNLRVIIASLCRYEFIETIVVWNNNLDVVLNHETFSTAQCPSSKLQINNSPQNILFLARHVACMQATTPYCFFQDDDWFVQPMRSLYAQFKRDPEGSVVVGTTKEMAINYRSNWCFFQNPLHTCFTWLGTGAFTSRNHVARYLEAVTTLDFPRDELAHADNSFTTFLNSPPISMGSNAIVEMKTGKGYSDGEKGDSRNKLYIQKGIEHFSRYLNASFSRLPATTPLPTTPVQIDMSFYRTPTDPPLKPHPYAHHARSPCVPSDLCFFVTNLPLLLPPDSTPYPGPHRVKTLGEWEHHVRTIGTAEQDWTLEWGYENAVDSKPGTTFRSLDVAKSGDFVGLGLIRPLDPIWTPSIVLHFVFDDVEKLLPNLEVQSSSSTSFHSLPTMKFFQTLKLPKPTSSPVQDSHNTNNNSSTGFTWTRLLSPLPSPSNETPSSGSYYYGLSPGTESWAGDSPRSDPEKPRDHGFPFPTFPDSDGAIFAASSPRLEDSEDEGLAFQDLRTPDSLRVIVVGSGFGGLSTAVACARQGFSVTVLERSSGKSAHGDSILLGPNATRLFYKWEIGKEMYRRSSRDNDWIFYDRAGRELHRESLGELPREYGAPICQGKRSQFIGVLGTEALLLGVKFRYEAEVTGYSDSEQPAVILKGGEIVRGDVVVVCDGIRSLSRTLLASPGRPPLPRRSSGYSIFRAILNVTPSFREDPLCGHFCDGNIRFWLGLDSHVEVWPMNDNNELAFTFTHPDVPSTSTLNSSKTTPISAILEEIAEWDPALRACIKKFPKALNWTIVEDTVEPRWISKGGKIVFAGDAIHPLSPASFHAGNQAVEDGATIAQCLALSGAETGKVPLALKVYERLRKERTEQAGKLGRKQQRILHTYILRKSGSSRLLDPAAASTVSASHSEVLRPLAYQLFEHDAEQYAIENFASIAKGIESVSRDQSS